MRKITWNELKANKNTAKVINNCGTIELENGEHVIASALINPEMNDNSGKLMREFINWENGDYIQLPVDYSE